MYMCVCNRVCVIVYLCCMCRNCILYCCMPFLVRLMCMYFLTSETADISKKHGNFLTL